MPSRQAPAVESLERAVRELDERLSDLEKNLTAQIADLGAAMESQRRLLQRYQAELDGYRRRRLWARFSPKLGVLYQYPPRALEIPDWYHRVASRDLPRISVVTPSLDQGAFLERTIRSVLDQEAPELEYRVQDGGSRDETTTVLARYRERLAGVESAPDTGQAQALNRAFARTSGEVLAYLNSDDLLLPGSLAYVGDFFARNPGVDVVYGHRVVIDERDREIGRWVLPRHDGAVLAWADYVPQETLFWRRRIWERAGARFDEGFGFALDWDLLLRFRALGARFVRLPRFLGAFRVHAGSKTSKRIEDLGIEEMDRLRERCHGRRPDHAEIRRGVRGYLVRHVILHKLYRLRLLRY